MTGHWANFSYISLLQEYGARVRVGTDKIEQECPTRWIVGGGRCISTSSRQGGSLVELTVNCVQRRSRKGATSEEGKGESAGESTGAGAGAGLGGSYPKRVGSGR